MTKRVAVITGGGGDMGLACARRLSGHEHLLLADVDGARLDRALEALRAQGVAAEGVKLDVSEPGSVQALAERTAALGELGALVHTAGLSPTMADGARIWQVNLVGTARLVEAFEPLAGAGSVAVLFASQAGHFARWNASRELDTVLDAPLADDLLDRLRALAPALLEPVAAYPGSKYGVIRLAARAAGPWGARGARVVSLSPGIIDTGMGRQEYEAQPFMATLVAQTPLRRMGTADEIAKVVEFLCSEAASFVTGTDLLVDGGATEAARPLLTGNA